MPNKVEQKDKIQGWLKENRVALTRRKRRNHALIQLGLAAVKMAQKNEAMKREILDNVIVNKLEICSDLIEKP